MKTIAKNNISIFLMGSSLLLLGFFLLFWLKEVYEREVTVLKEKSSFIFINSIREAEMNYFKEVFIKTKSNWKTEEDSLAFAAISMDISAKKEARYSFFEGSDTLIASINPKLNVQINATKGPEIKHEKGGFLLWNSRLKSKRLPSDSLPIVHRDSATLEIIAQLVHDSPKSNDLPSNFRIVKIKDTLSHWSNLLSEPYTDLENGDQFAMKIEGFQPYILKQMLPQMLFSTLLFSITSLAFYFIYKSLKEQQLLTELKNDLISNISHELKTPIATVGVAIEALQNFDALKNPKRTKEYLNISKMELNRLSILIDKVLNTSLFERSKLSLKLETVDLKRLVENVLDSMKLQFENQQASVHFSINGNNFLLEGDKIHLTSIIFNLLDNALKYSKLKKEIYINLKNNSSEIELMVKDKGIGIPNEFKAKIFDKFFRVPSGNTHNVKGHGLGLSYVKSVVERHRGNIEVESEKEQGTVFRITLPKSA